MTPPHPGSANVAADGSKDAHSSPPPPPSSSSSSLTCITTLLPPVLTVGGEAPAATTLSYLDPSPVWQVSFSLDGAWLVVAVGSPSSCIRVYHNQTAQQRPRHAAKDDADWMLQATLRNHESTNPRTVRSVAVAPMRTLTSNDETMIVLASASFDGSISIWEYNSKQTAVNTTNTTNTTTCNHDHHNHNCNNDDSFSSSWHCVTQLEGHESEVKCVCWNATASLLASCGRDKTVWIWEHLADNASESNSDWECLAVLPGHDADVKCLQFAASHDQWGDGDEIVLSGSYDDTVKIWAEDAGEWYCAASLANVHTSTIWSLAVAPSSTRFVSGSADGSLAIYKCYSYAEYRRAFPEEASANTFTSRNGVWKCVGKLSDAHSEPVYSVSYAPARCGHGRIASGGGDGQIQVYRETLESTSDHPKFVLDASVATDHGDVNHVCWHPWDGSILVSAGDDGAVRMWRYTSS